MLESTWNNLMVRRESQLSNWELLSEASSNQVRFWDALAKGHRERIHPKDLGLRVNCKEGNQDQQIYFTKLSWISPGINFQNWKNIDADNSCVFCNVGSNSLGLDLPQNSHWLFLSCAWNIGIVGDKHFSTQENTK